MWEGGATRIDDNCLAVCGAPSTVYTPGHIFIVLRRSPAEIASPSPSPRRRDAGTHPLPRCLAGSRRHRRHQAERVLDVEVSYVRYSISWITKTVRLHQPRCQTLPLTVYEDT